MTEESQTKYKDRLKKLASGEKITEKTEYEIIRKNGKQNWVQSINKFIFNSEGLLGADVVAHDITERKRVEDTQRRVNEELEQRIENRTKELMQVNEELRAEITERKQMEKVLREKEEKYRAFFDTSRDCVFITSINGHWLELNDAALQLFGYGSREELLNVQVQDLYENPDQREKHLRLINEQGYLQEKSFALRKKDGTIIDVLITSVVRKDDTGKIIGYQGTIRDVTERKQREKLLRISEERFRSLVETTSDWLWETDAQGVYTYASPKVKDILGYESSEIVGKTPVDLLLPAEAERVAKIILQYFKEQEPFITFENLNIHKRMGGRLFSKQVAYPSWMKMGS